MRGKSNMYHLIVHLLLLAGIVIVVFPFVWMVLTSFKTNGESASAFRRQSCRSSS